MLTQTVFVTDDIRSITIYYLSWLHVSTWKKKRIDRTITSKSTQSFTFEKSGTSMKNEIVTLELLTMNPYKRFHQVSRTRCEGVRLSTCPGRSERHDIIDKCYPILACRCHDLSIHFQSFPRTVLHFWWYFIDIKVSIKANKDWSTVDWPKMDESKITLSEMFQALLINVGTKCIDLNCSVNNGSIKVDHVRKVKSPDPKKWPERGLDPEECTCVQRYDEWVTTFSRDWVRLWAMRLWSTSVDFNLFIWSFCGSRVERDLCGSMIKKKARRWWRVGRRFFSSPVSN